MILAVVIPNASKTDVLGRTAYFVNKNVKILRSNLTKTVIFLNGHHLETDLVIEKKF
jgi:hypothetical protein